jgi:hypothetical protein
MRCATEAAPDSSAHTCALMRSSVFCTPPPPPVAAMVWDGGGWGHWWGAVCCQRANEPAKLLLRLSGSCVALLCCVCARARGCQSFARPRYCCRDACNAANHTRTTPEPLSHSHTPSHPAALQLLLHLLSTLPQLHHALTPTHPPHTRNHSSHGAPYPQHHHKLDRNHQQKQPAATPRLTAACSAMQGVAAGRTVWPPPGAAAAGGDACSCRGERCVRAALLCVCGRRRSGGADAAVCVVQCSLPQQQSTAAHAHPPHPLPACS